MSVETILDGLNEAQRKVATYVDGQAVVLAGAGSGKTHTLARRIAYLIEIGVPAWAITATSFTKKASREIKERVIQVVGSEGIHVRMGTFHSLCMSILLPNQEKLFEHGLLNQERFTILTEEDVLLKLTDLAMIFGITGKDEVRELNQKIGSWSNNHLLPASLTTEDASEAEILTYKEFILYKKNMGYVDYNDMLSLTLELLKKDETILDLWSKRIRYFLVDECQDLNDIQFELLYYLTSHFNNYMLIGDDLQSLYRFRGANVNNMINLAQEASTVDVLLLERNYRSTQTIVNTSNALIAHNVHQLEKVAYSENVVGNPVFVYISQDDTKEADYLIEMIQGYIAQGKKQYSDIAVIFRSNWVSRQIELALSSVGIPFEVRNGTSFFEKKEIRDIAAYLRVVNNPVDDIALNRIINVPKRGVGEGTVDKIKMYASENELSLFATLRHIQDVKGVSKKAKESILELVDIIEEARRFVFEGEAQSIHYLINLIIRRTNFLSQFDPLKTEDETRIDNLAEVSRIAMDFDNQLAFDRIQEGYEPIVSDSLSMFISGTSIFELDNIEDEDTEETKDRVTLTTVHSAKGLEWPVVFVVGLEEGTFPSYFSATKEDMEEERRCMYVAMTRAKEQLFLSYNERRYNFGTYKDCKPSRFLSELPKENLRVFGAKGRKTSEPTTD